MLRDEILTVLDESVPFSAAHVADQLQCAIPQAVVALRTLIKRREVYAAGQRPVLYLKNSMLTEWILHELDESTTPLSLFDLMRTYRGLEPSQIRTILCEETKRGTVQRDELSRYRALPPRLLE